MSCFVSTLPVAGKDCVIHISVLLSCILDQSCVHKCYCIDFILNEVLLFVSTATFSYLLYFLIIRTFIKLMVQNKLNIVQNITSFVCNVGLNLLKIVTNCLTKLPRNFNAIWVYTILVQCLRINL